MPCGIKLTEHLKTVDDSNVSDAELEVTSELNGKITQAEKSLASLKDSERHLAAGSEDNKDANGNAVVISRGAQQRARPFTLAQKKIDPLEYLVRARRGADVRASPQAAESTRRASASHLEPGDDEATKALVEYAAKAATAPAMTTVTGWAAELVQQINADFMETLMPQVGLSAAVRSGLVAELRPQRPIAIPTRSRTPTIAGSFVGEGAPIPVRQGAFTAQLLTPKKMAVITTWTREMDEHSVPAIEGLLRNAIQEDTAISLDTVLLDANAATVIRPAGLLNGVAGLTPTAGGGFNALVGDLKQLSGAMMTGTSGNVRAMAWLMNPQQVLVAWR